MLRFVYPNLSPFHKLMCDSKVYINKEIEKFKNRSVKLHYGNVLQGAENADIFFDVYFNKGERVQKKKSSFAPNSIKQLPGSRDLGLLITLLASSHGIAEGLRFISLFDKDYQKLWKPIDMKVSQDPHKDHVVHVEWDDAPIAGYVHRYSCKLGVEYTVEIFPNASEGSMKNQVIIICLTLQLMPKMCLFRPGLRQRLLLRPRSGRRRQLDRLLRRKARRGCRRGQKFPARAETQQKRAGF